MFKDPLLPGSTLSVGGKEVEVDSIIAKADFLAGRPFIKSGRNTTSSSEIKLSPASKAHQSYHVLQKQGSLDKHKEKKEQAKSKLRQKPFTLQHIKAPP